MTMICEEKPQRPSSQELLHLLYQALLKVPRGMGDHTDLCRMKNNGLPPTQDTACQCHVGPVRKAISAFAAAEP